LRIDKVHFKLFRLQGNNNDKGRLGKVVETGFYGFDLNSRPVEYLKIKGAFINKECEEFIGHKNVQSAATIFTIN